MNKYLEKERNAVYSAYRAYDAALKALQETCEHSNILKYTDSGYLTYRICEDCGLEERSQWDSSYRYKHLGGRAYAVSFHELAAARPKSTYIPEEV